MINRIVGLLEYSAEKLQKTAHSLRLCSVHRDLNYIMDIWNRSGDTELISEEERVKFYKSKSRIRAVDSQDYKSMQRKANQVHKASLEGLKIECAAAGYIDMLIG